jgi:hypothetical protein
MVSSFLSILGFDSAIITVKHGFIYLENVLEHHLIVQEIERVSISVSVYAHGRHRVSHRGIREVYASFGV